MHLNSPSLPSSSRSFLAVLLAANLFPGGATHGGPVAATNEANTSRANDHLPPAGMMAIPAGTFQMGDTVDGAGSPTANIYISRFYIDRTEVSKEKWDEVRAWAAENGFTDLATGSSYGGALHPVHSITWYDAVKWCNARSLKEGLVPCYYTSTSKTEANYYKTGSVNLTADMVNWTADGYRLPTESEWEKAARGGLTNKRFPWGDTITHSQANYHASTASYPTYDLSPTQGYHPTYKTGTAPCGTFPANGYGLYDMAANLWEWTWDRYGGTLGMPSENNPTGPASGSYRVVRGGAWGYSANLARCADRASGDSPGNAYYACGFRAVRR